MQNRSVFLLILAALSLAQASCGGGDKRKPTFPVAGKVTLDGRPAEHATVILHPVGDSDPDAVKPRGKVAADGSFKLTTYETDDGAPAGEYRVTVELWLASSRADEPPSNRLSPKYGKVESSGLKATVNAAPTELAPIALKK